MQGLCDRNGKVRPLGFDAALTVLTLSLSAEARTNLRALIRDVAAKYSHNDAQAQRTLLRRLRTVARRKAWAREVQRHLAAHLEAKKAAKGVLA